ncbi:MAG: PQQ-binding-like beta-propeller repeat protein [Bryobacteraceae bacterium]|nr:PQQ-binding-like beta-propeller repeat protein [Bryobacteraceae bacterium]MDW8378240.1 PQQ-binding-like beta-propeller repeat protein [Bryobacterales bacterium]
MTTALPLLFRLFAAAPVTCGLLWAADWLTDGGDIRRTNWQRDEKILTKANIKNLRLLWKTKLDNQQRQMHSLLEPLVIGRVVTKSGPRELVIQAGVSDNVYALDAKTGKLVWKRHFESTYQDPIGGRGPSVLCPGGMTANVTIGPGPTPGQYIIYAASWDGRLHWVNAADGEELRPPAKFMPPNGKPYALNLVNNVIYTHTAQGCGGHPNMVYAYDLETHKVGSWGPAGGGMWGRSGPAVSKDLVMYTGTGDGKWDPENGLYGNGIIGVKQNPETKALELVDYYGPSNAEWLWKRDLDMQVTPAIFEWKGREYMVDASKECRIYLMDTESIGGDDHRTPVYRTPLICNELVDFAEAGIWGSMATWEDPKGERWVLAPFWGPKHSKFRAPIEHGEVKKGAIVAFKMGIVNGKVELIPAWISRDMNQAEPPLIANGMVFAYGSGENTSQAYPDVGLDFRMERRVPLSTHAVLYVLDAETGKELWNSGKQITNWNHWSGLALANGKVYINTWDGHLYCFGLRP